MHRHSLITLLASGALAAACTTPKAPYEVGNRSVKTPEDATSLMKEVTDSRMAEWFSKASSPPKLKHAVAPTMSAAAANHGGMGTVLVEVLVAKDGRVTAVKVLESPNQYLSEDVSVALKQWVFTPLVIEGESRAFTFRHPFHFRLGS